jgi:hypothetical protein
MTARQTGVVALLTAVYLCIELAFNARLLDVVGGAANSEQIHQIETWGRSLSGAAVALFVLTSMLKKSNRWPHPTAWKLAIPLACLLAGYGVFRALEEVVDYLVAQSSPEFRRASSSIVLVQQALVSGAWRVDGLSEDAAIFARPEGKAFLAQFALIAASVERLDSKIGEAKAAWIAQAASDRIGGPAAAYESYAKGVRAAHDQWRRYSGAGRSEAGEDAIARQQDRAWNEYVQKLRRRGVTPYTVPDASRAQVLREVRQKVPVPPDWDLADEDGFRRAVAEKMRGGSDSATSVSYNGKRIPAGLSWGEFIGHPVVQAELRQKLKLTVPVRVEPHYRSGTDFAQKVFQPQINDEVRRRLRALDKPAAAYADGGELQREGRNAARMAIVPPLALFCSMVGALVHLAKLSYLLLRLALMRVPAWQRALRFVWLAPAAVLLAGWAAAARADNEVTQSRLYRYLQAQVRQDGEPLRSHLKAHALHLVAVGQGYAYPVNDLIRRRALAGFSFGYEEARRPRSSP